MRRGQIQLRGRISWKARRFQVLLKYGSANVGRMPIVFGNAVPKNGSKLLFNILRGLTLIGPMVDTGLNEIKPFFHGKPTSPEWIRHQIKALRPGDIRLGYLYATPANIQLLCKNGWANFFILRDPRDAVVSEVFYALEIHTDHLLHDYLASRDSMESRLNTIISGIPDGALKRVDVRGHYERFWGWIEQSDICIIRFEDLITSPKTELEKMFDYLISHGFEPFIPRHQALDVLQSQMTPRKSTTFRKGIAGDWRNHFTQENKTRFKQIAGDLLIRLGYEKTNDW
jgi:hypothetical protein